ncbi:hypothetical protein [Moraxella sp. 7624LN]|uniref:hypothetical protein n=1 Tax=Moraxella sp. 7624LN TaxID=3110542 RepID=UPI002B41673E|nr:hypothetical protein [Moraxella sp. 7624LN]
MYLLIAHPQKACRQNLGYAVCGVRCAVCGVRCAVCGVRCAVCGVRCADYTHNLLLVKLFVLYKIGKIGAMLGNGG